MSECVGFNVPLVERQTVIAITQQKTSERGLSLDVDGRHADKGKTEHSTKGNSIE